MNEGNIIGYWSPENLQGGWAAYRSNDGSGNYYLYLNDSLMTTVGDTITFLKSGGAQRFGLKGKGYTQ